jgi:hypothetical protein
MSGTESVGPPGGQLAHGAMGPADIVFFVLAGPAAQRISTRLSGMIFISKLLSEA